MSAEAVGWVFRHSPYQGAAFAVHLAIADSVNDQNDNELWMALGRVAAKARVTRKTASEAVARMVADGRLHVVEDHRNDRAGRPSRFRFQFVAEPAGVSPDYAPPVEGGVSADYSRGESSVLGGVSADYSRGESSVLANPREPKDKPKRTQEPLPSPAAPTKPTDDPVKRHAHELTVLAFEQPVKPALRGGGGGAFPAAMHLVEQVLRAGVSVPDVRRAVVAGVEVWTLAGLQTAIARCRSSGSRSAGLGPGPAVNEVSRASRDLPAGRIL